MVAFDANEVLIPCREADSHGAIVFDRRCITQAEVTLFSPEHWGSAAQPVTQGGRGSAWFVDAPFGQCVLRHYRRGGMAAWISNDAYFWQGAKHTRSFVEFCLMRRLCAKKLPVPRPVAALYLRTGLSYRAALLMQRLENTESLVQWMQREGSDAPWEATGHLIARFHRVGLDHADLNANNILFDEHRQGWLIDFDRCQLRIPATDWRESNLARLQRSLHKLRGSRTSEAIDYDFLRLRQAYESHWQQGI